MFRFFLSRGHVAELVGMLRWIGLQPKELVSLLGLTLAQTLTDGLGVALVYPLLAFVANGPEAFSASAPFPLPQVANALVHVGLPLGLPVLLAMLFFTLLAREGFSFLRASTVSKVANRRSSALQARALHAYVEADLPFHIARNSGAFVANVAGDCMQAGTLIILVTDALSLLFVGAFYGAVLLTLSVPLTLTIAAGALLSLPLFHGQAVRVRTIGAEILESLRLFNIRLNEVFRAIRLVKVRAQEPMAAEHIAEVCRQMAHGTWRRDRASAAIDALIRPLFIVTALIIFYVALTFLNTTLAALVTFIFGTTRLIPVIARLGVLRGQIPSYMHGPFRVRAMMEEAARLKKVAGGDIAFTGIGDGIRFENVTFQYEESTGQAALRDVSFFLKAGEMVAIVGPSGAGKSTLVDLMCRFYEPGSGRIVVDGRDIRDFSLKSYRTSISLVQQDPLMFDDTIRGNLNFGLEEKLDDAAIQDLLRRAHCLDFVETFPDRFDTRIGERGVRLSGGQRQRLALARALANQPTLLLLDEPTSALDSMSEQAIQQTLRELHGAVTVIVVAHRFSTIVDADRILVLQEGRIMAEGTHDSLMHKDGIYSDLFKIQTNMA